MAGKRASRRAAPVARIVKIASAIGIVAVMVSAPNALWLGSSTAVLRNGGTEAVEFRLMVSDAPGRTVETEPLGPGQSRFMVLDVVGEASLEIAVRQGESWHLVCREYVEQAMYRVEVLVTAPDRVRCRVNLPIFDHLLVADLLL